MTQANAIGSAAAAAEVTKSNSEILEDVLSKSLYASLANKGDISDLSVTEKTSYMKRLCESLGLNPLTQPFIPIILKNKNQKTDKWEEKEVLYATRGCTDQLTAINKLTREIINTERIEDVYVATAKVSGPDGRFDISTGAVTIGNLKGDSLANALMKAETKAKRRATLCYCGLGFLDESELETIPRERIERPQPLPSNGKTVDAGPSDAPKRPTKSEMVDQAKQALETDGLKSQIVKLGAAIGMEESAEKTLKFIDDNPKEAERAYCKAVRVSFRKLTESDKWPYADEGTTAYLEKHGITVLDEASRGQLESLVNQLEGDGLLKTAPAS